MQVSAIIWPPALWMMLRYPILSASSRKGNLSAPCVYLEFPSLTDFSNYSNLADCDVGHPDTSQNQSFPAHCKAAVSQIFIRNHDFPFNLLLPTAASTVGASV